MAKAERGAKAAFVREGVKRYPDERSPKALAERLNEEAREKGPNISSIRGQDISQMRLQLREAARRGRRGAARRGAAPASTPAAPPPSHTEAGAVPLDALHALRGLANRLGKERVRELLDLLG